MTKKDSNKMTLSFMYWEVKEIKGLEIRISMNDIFLITWQVFMDPDGDTHW